MKTLVGILAGVLGLAVFAVAGAALYFFAMLPAKLPVPEFAIERTPERVARGEYLANAVFGCMYCHSERDWSRFSGPPKPGRLGSGGEIFDASVGVSGYLVAPNLTPSHLGSWSDGEIYRAITSGLHKDGYAFFPVMPFDAYLHLTTEDVHSIIAYLRTLPEIPDTNDYSKRRLSPIMTIIANTRAIPADPWTVDENDPLSRGEYLTIIMGCRFCHTPADERMQPYEDRRFAGGLGMVAQGRKVYSANITPDPETGIGNWAAADFIARFKAYEGKQIPVSEVGYNTQHAWTEYAKLTEADLGAIYAYLMNQPPVKQKVTPLGGIEPAGT